MKSHPVKWAVAAAMAFVCLTLAACESSSESAGNPGDLPREADSSTPRINAATYAAHGELLERRGDFSRAAEQYRAALEINPRLTSTRNRLGVTLNKLGEHAAASAEFRLALEAQPEQAYLCNNLGFSLYLEDKYAEAEEVLRRATDLDPAFRRARMNLGVVLAQLERYDEALEQFGEAGPLGDAYFNLGVVQAQKGAYVAAAASFEQAISNDPGLDAARDQLRQIARLTAVEENGGSETYPTDITSVAAGFDQATPEPSAPVVEEVSTPIETPATVPPADVAAVVISADLPGAPSVASSAVGQMDASDAAAPSPNPDAPVQSPVNTQVVDPRTSAAPPITTMDTVAHVAASEIRSGVASPSADHASILTFRDPWADLFVAPSPRTLPVPARTVAR